MFLILHVTCLSSFDEPFFMNILAKMNDINGVNGYVSFETAKLLSEKGYNNTIRSHYDDNGILLVSTYAAFWVTPAPTYGQALEWLRSKNVYASFYVDKDENNKATWQFAFYDKYLNLLADDCGISITDYNKCVELAIVYAAKFLIYK